MEKLKINLLVGLFLVFSNFIFAQSEVSGNISDSEGNPIPGVTIIIDGTTNGTTSDFDEIIAFPLVQINHFSFLVLDFQLKLFELETNQLLIWYCRHRQRHLTKSL